MSATSTVPAVVPSVFQSSLPSATVSPVKNMLLPTLVRNEGWDLANCVSGSVPASLPSLVHSSGPAGGCHPANSTWPSSSVNRKAPTSSTCTVPASDPSVFQSLLYAYSPYFVKKSVPDAGVNSAGCELAYSPAGLMSLSSTVPSAVPSLFQSSKPSSTLPSAVK
jgi:hypothetical protein